MSNLENVLGGKFDAVEGSVERVPKPPHLLTAPIPTFEKTFDAERLATLNAHAPKFATLSGRFNPLSEEKLRISVGTWSVLINKAVVTFDDACDHAMALCRLWQQEDVEIQAMAISNTSRIAKKKAAEETDIMNPESKAYALEQARVAWKDAVRRRNEAVRQWDAYVEATRNEYRRLRNT